MKTLSDFNFKGKTVLLRADLNSDNKGKQVLIGERIKAASETIKELKKKKARVVVIAHQGQPGRSDFLSLKQHSRLLSKFVKIDFVNDVAGEKAIKAIENLKNGQAILLENVRFEKDEFFPEKKNNKLLKLAGLFDIYVNDAFSVSHREHVSIVGFPKHIKKKCAGRLLEKEVKALRKINLKKCLYILGGAKPGDYLSLLNGNKILACGLFGQSCLISKGKDLGAQNEYLRKEARLDENLKKEIRERMRNVITPIDFAVKVNDKRKELSLDEFPSKYEIFDIGKETIEKYTKEIKKAKNIFMKGPAGAFSEKGFAKGTNALLRVIADNKGFSLIGGGHVSDAIEKSGISKKKFSHISLSGGALLRIIAGEKLPGLEVLG
jgi:phosphoglycerate kinase